MTMCCICGVPPSICRLIRITFVDDGKGRLESGSPEGDFRLPSPAVAEMQKTNDSLVCEDCIRGIKRIPLSDLGKIPVGPMHCGSCELPTSACSCPAPEPFDAKDLPF